MKTIKNFFKRIGRFIKKHQIISIIIILIMVGTAFLLRPKPAKPVPAVTVKKSNFTQTVSVSGNIDSLETVSLGFLVGAKLTYLGAAKGDTVTAGQTIAVEDQATAQKNLESALIAYSEQRNSFDQTQVNNLNHTPSDALNDNMKRILENNQFDLNKAIVSVQLQDLARQQSVLTTPISGIVTAAGVQAAGVNVGPTTTFTISNPNKMTFIMDVDEADVSKIKLGQSVSITLDAYPNSPFTLPITNIDFATHTTSTGGNAYSVQANLPTNPDLAYRIGMQGNADIVTAQETNVISVPISSIFDNNYVYVEKGNLFEKRKITLGIQNNTDSVVEQGLSEGEQVVIDPTQVPQNSVIKS
jgi:HlyD family secretion protein